MQFLLIFLALLDRSVQGLDVLGGLRPEDVLNQVGASGSLDGVEKADTATLVHVHAVSGFFLG